MPGLMFEMTFCRERIMLVRKGFVVQQADRKSLGSVFSAFPGIMRGHTRFDIIGEAAIKTAICA
jgi:hypothetical protein